MLLKLREATQRNARGGGPGGSSAGPTPQLTSVAPYDPVWVKYQEEQMARKAAGGTPGQASDQEWSQNLAAIGRPQDRALFQEGTGRKRDSSRAGAHAASSFSRLLDGRGGGACAWSRGS